MAIRRVFIDSAPRSDSSKPITPRLRSLPIALHLRHPATLEILLYSAILPPPSSSSPFLPLLASSMRIEIDISSNGRLLSRIRMERSWKMESSIIESFLFYPFLLARHPPCKDRVGRSPRFREKRERRHRRRVDLVRREGGKGGRGGGEKVEIEGRG